MPVHTTGYTSDLKSGHAWVIDGNRYRRRPWVGSMVLYDDNVPIYGYLTGGYLEEHFLQCNFGWDGNSDGLYASGLFNTGSYSFVSKLKIIPFISPK